MRAPIRRSRTALAVVLVTALVVVAPTTASAGVLDQSNPVFGSGSHLTCPNVSLVQTFTAGMNGLLDRLELGAWRSGPTSLNPLQIQIQSVSPDGFPTSFILAQEQLAASALPAQANPTMVSVPLDPPLRVFDGTRYAIILVAIGLPCDDGSYAWQLSGDGSAYAAGDAFTWSDNFSTLVPIPTDFTFNTYVDDGVIEEYPFHGFFRPVRNPPVVNTWLAAQPMPIRFSLEGDRGLDILAVRPRVAPISCRTLLQTGATWNAGMSPLELRSDGVYQFYWKTLRAAGGKCRRLTVILDDGTSHALLVRFLPRTD